MSRCLDSILTQTYRNLEIVLVDDGSLDRSGEICDEYLKKDSRIHVIHKKNGGLSDARNVGIEHAHGKYIGFIDSDDWIAKDMFEVLYRNLDRYRADISICQFKFTASEKISVDKSKEFINVYSRHQAIDAMFMDRIFASHACNKLYKMHLFKKIRFPLGKVFEDQFTLYKIIWACDKVVYTNRQCYFYYIRENSIARASFYTKQLDILDALDLCIEFFKKNYINVVKYIQYCWVDNYLILLMSAIQNESDLSVFEARKHTLKQYKKGYSLYKKARLVMKVAAQLAAVNIGWFRAMFKVFLRIKK